MKNQMLITIDSLRFDVFNNAKIPFLKKHLYEKAYTMGTYTLPAHTAFFTGKLPCNYTNGVFDNLARIKRTPTHKQQWRLANPESKQPCCFELHGKNIVEGFNKIGYNTIGTGAVSWFNPTKPAHISTINDFRHYKWFGEYTVAPKQIAFVQQEIEATKGCYFAFMNLGETHHPFKTLKTDRQTNYGDSRCIKAQQRCIEYLDKLLQPFLESLNNIDLFICSDHGECLGEDGLWGHSFFHQKVIEVPIIKISK